MGNGLFKSFTLNSQPASKLELRLIKCFLYLAFISLGAQEATAGLLISPGVSTAAFSFRPDVDEETPNYYAFAPELTLGYSLGQVLDIAIKTTYYPGSRKAPRFATESTSLLMYGAEIALRISHSVYLGMRGGTYIYNLVYADDDGNDVDGRWAGPGGGLGVGAIIRKSRDRFWQVSFDAETFVGSQLEPEPVRSAKRRMDIVKLSVSYVYNGSGKLSVFDKFVGNLFEAWGL